MILSGGEPRAGVCYWSYNQSRTEAFLYAITLERL